MRFDHLGIAVGNLTTARRAFEPLADGPPGAPETVEAQKVRVLFLNVGGAHLELLEPTESGSPVARFLAARGEGIHHVAFEVPSVDAALGEVRARGGRTVDATARPGARGRRVGFAHPAAFHGALVEFVEGP